MVNTVRKKYDRKMVYTDGNKNTIEKCCTLLEKNRIKKWCTPLAKNRIKKCCTLLEKNTIKNGEHC